MSRIGALSAVLFVITFTGSALAGANPDAELALDCRAHESRQCGATYADCGGTQYRYTGTGEYDILVVLYNFTGVTAVDYRLDYSGVADAEFLGFTSCSTLDIENPVPGAIDVAHAWSDCQPAPGGPGSGIVVGWLHLVGGAGAVRIQPTSWFGNDEIIDCEIQSDLIAFTHDGFVGGAAVDPGYLGPCGNPTAAEESTWGGVKRLYR